MNYKTIATLEKGKQKLRISYSPEKDYFFAIYQSGKKIDDIQTVKQTQLSDFIKKSIKDGYYGFIQPEYYKPL